MELQKLFRVGHTVEWKQMFGRLESTSMWYWVIDSHFGPGIRKKLELKFW